VDRRSAIRTPLVLSEGKARQASKLAEIRNALVAAGYDTAAKQALALGVSRPTAWALLNRDKRAGPSAKILKRILSSPSLPPAVRRKFEEYIEEKIGGLYGHGTTRRRWLRDQFPTLHANRIETLRGSDFPRTTLIMKSPTVSPKFAQEF